MFTDKFIRCLTGRNKPYREWEQGADRGFGVQVTPAGTKTFFVFYTHHGKRRFMNLGRYPDTSLKDARERCRDARGLLEDGIDPQTHRASEQARLREEAEEVERKHREAELQGSVEQLFGAYVGDLQANGKRSWPEVRRALYRDALPVLGNTTKAREVMPHHIKLVLHRLIKRGAVIGANRLRAYMSSAFRFGIEHDNDARNVDATILFFIESNPVRDVPKPAKSENAGERDLSADEIRDLWWHLSGGECGMSAPSSIALRLLLAAGGQRVSEVLGAEWSEFDTVNMRWEIPGTRTKNRKAHVMPITPLVVKLLDELAPFAGDSIHLFPKQGGKCTEEETPASMPYSSLSQAVSRFCKARGFTKFTPRDLRRTCKTRMGEIGISKDIRDKIHNHAQNDVSTKHYDRYDYLAEKRQAMDAWERWLNMVVLDNQTPNNLIQMVR